MNRLLAVGVLAALSGLAIAHPLPNVLFIAIDDQNTSPDIMDNRDEYFLSKKK